MLDCFKIMTLDGDTVEVFDSLALAEVELSYYDDEHCIQEITQEEYDEFLAENGFA